MQETMNFLAEQIKKNKSSQTVLSTEKGCQKMSCQSRKRELGNGVICNWIFTVNYGIVLN